MTARAIGDLAPSAFRDGGGSAFVEDAEGIRIRTTNRVPGQAIGEDVQPRESSVSRRNGLSLRIPPIVIARIGAS